jgi:glycosyltransferase involved in cell wall biosynthesis
MAERFLQSHVFVLPSYVENSPNSLGEAMMVGTPSVVSYCGGVGSIVDDESALIFPIGDSQMLAFQIDRIFQSDALACELSDGARRIAGDRHDVEKTTDSYINIYEKVIDMHQ